VLVVGCSGAGKTVLAKRIAERIGAPHVELDGLHWGPDWTAASAEELRERVDRATSEPAWVVDGNYEGKIGRLAWDRADTVVWLDPPRWRVMRQVLARTLRRSFGREELWNGNRESWTGLLIWRNENDAILRWAWNAHPRIRARYGPEFAAARADGARLHRLRTRRDVDRFVAELR
jgi:adenylate kinase family enzyme